MCLARSTRPCLSTSAALLALEHREMQLGEQRGGSTFVEAPYWHKQMAW